MINGNPGIDESGSGSAIITVGNTVITALQEHVDEADVLMTSCRNNITNGQVKILLNKAADVYNRLVTITMETKGVLAQQKKLADKSAKAIEDSKIKK